MTDDAHRAIDCDPIGTVSTPFRTREDAPRQGLLGDAEGTVHLDPAHEPGLAGLDPGDSVVVVWYAHRADRSTLRVRDGDRGVFASRSPDRPTPVCLTTCEVLAVDGPDLRVRGVDMLDGSPVLDLKAALDGG